MFCVKKEKTEELFVISFRRVPSYGAKSITHRYRR